MHGHAHTRTRTHTHSLSLSLPFSSCPYEIYPSPLEVVHTALGHTIMDDAHGLDHLLLDLRAAHDVKLRQEMVGHGNQSVLGPALEPVHGAARDQPGELEGSLSELLSNLLRKMGTFNKWRQVSSPRSAPGSWGLSVRTSLQPVTQSVMQHLISVQNKNHYQSSEKLIFIQRYDWFGFKIIIIILLKSWILFRDTTDLGSK